MQPGLLPMEKLLYISQHGFHLFLAQKLSVSPTVICFLCVALPSSLGCAGICRYHFCGWVGGPSDVWVYLWINRTWLLSPEKIMKIFFPLLWFFHHKHTTEAIISFQVQSFQLHAYMDLKIWFSSRCLLLCEAVLTVQWQNRYTHKPVFVRATVGRELHWKAKNIKQQKQKKSESTKKERVKTAMSGSKGTTEWSLVVKASCL